MDWQTLLAENWPVYAVSVTLIVAAWIDGKELRVPNWITFPMVGTGFVFNMFFNPEVVGWGEGLSFAFLGMCAGLMTLLPLYAVGGMGAGDVKLMAGMGAWLGWNVTLWAFVYTGMVGAALAIVMVLFSRAWKKHYDQFLMIAVEWLTIKDPRKLSEIAAERKPSMYLLPYGIPICIGSIAYFFKEGMMY